MSRDVLEELVTKFVYDVDQLGLQKYTKAQEKINKNTQKMIGLNSTLAKGLRRLFVGAGAVMGIQGLVKNFRELDLARRSIEGLTGSTQDFEFLKEEAFRTATAIDVVAQSYKGFYAAANMSKFSKDEIQGMYGDLLTGLRGAGSTPERVKGALLSIEQMFSKGTIQAQELRLQLGNALPGAFELMASAVGVTTKELDTMMRKGLLPATKYVPLLIKEIKNYYQTGFIKNVQSLDAALINLNNAWQLFQDEIMRGSAGQALAETLQDLTGFLRSPEAITIAKGIGQALNLVARVLGFVVKHFRMILFIFGINMLSQLPSLLGMIEKNILKIIGTSGGLIPYLQNIAKTGLLIGKNFLWITVIVGVLYTLYLLIQDIFTYINHPEWESFTKDLAQKFPIIDEMIKDIRKTTMEFLDKLKPTLEVLGGVVKDFISVIMEYVRGKHPVLTGALKVLLGVLTAIMWTLTQIIKFINFLNGSKTITQPNIPDVKKAERGWQKAATISAYKPTFKDKVRGFFTPKIPQFSDRYYGGMDLNRTSNETTNVNNNQKIVINAANRSDSEILALIRGALNNDYESVMAMTNQTPAYYGAEV